MASGKDIVAASMAKISSPGADGSMEATPISSPTPGAGAGAQMKRDFSVTTLISIGWNMVNVFGGLSYVFVIGFSAGGIPAILYGFIGASFCVLCLTAILAECAATFPTAGGAYNFSTFLAPAKYRRYVGYPLGWLNYLGWLITICACCSICTGLTYSLVILCKEDFAVTARWQLFLMYVAWAIFAWAVNIFWLPGVQLLSNIGCWVSFGAFIAFFIALLAIAPKPSAAFVFHDVVDKTGFHSAPMAVVIGLYNSISIFVSLDAGCHLAEEMPHPSKTLPKILYFTTFFQILVGIVWILAIGFSITDPDRIVSTPTGVPVIEVVRVALRSNGAAIVFNLSLLILYISATCGATITTSRQGMALARDGGMLFKTYLTKISPRYNLPVNSVHFATGWAILIGLIYLLSNQGFNAMLGTASLIMIESYAAPSLMMVCFGRGQLKKTPFSLGRLGYPCCVVSIFYALLSTVALMFPASAPVSVSNMNYASLLYGICFFIMVILWFADARKSYQPPSYDEFLIGVVPVHDLKNFVAAGAENSLEDGN